MHIKSLRFNGHSTSVYTTATLSSLFNMNYNLGIDPALLTNREPGPASTPERPRKKKRGTNFSLRPVPSSMEAKGRVSIGENREFAEFTFSFFTDA